MPRTTLLQLLEAYRAAPDEAARTLAAERVEALIEARIAAALREAGAPRVVGPEEEDRRTDDGTDD